MGRTFDDLGESVYEEVSKLSGGNRLPVVKERAECTNSVYFEGVGRVHDTPVFLLGALEVGDVVEGPSILIDETQTIVLLPGARALVTNKHLYVTLKT